MSNAGQISSPSCQCTDNKRSTRSIRMRMRLRMNG